jgi:hypothetical protein
MKRLITILIALVTLLSGCAVTLSPVPVGYRGDGPSQGQMYYSVRDCAAVPNNNPLMGWAKGVTFANEVRHERDAEVRNHPYYGIECDWRERASSRARHDPTPRGTK